MSVSVFAVSLGLTLLLELPFVYLWGLRSRRDLKLAVLANVLTNPAVVLLHGLGLPALPLEAAAVAAEGFCYRVRGDRVRRPFLLALLVNALSYGLGLFLNRFF